jgi:hypothetical protein
MYSVGVGDLRRAHDVRNIQVGVATRRLSNANGLIGKTNVQAVFISSGINGNRFDAHVLAGANHPQCNLSSIGDHYFFEHAFNLVKFKS